MVDRIVLPSDLEEQKAPSPVQTQEQVRLPSEEGQPLERGIIEDTAKGVGSGLVRGTAQLPGFVGGISQVAELPGKGVNWLIAHGMESLGMLPKGKTAADLLAATKELEAKFQSPEEQRGEVSRIAGLPIITPSGSIKIVEREAPAIKPITQYEPSTVTGKLGQKGMEAIPGAMIGPGGIAAKLAVGFGAGAGAEAGTLIAGEEYGLAASLFGALAGGLAGAGFAATGRAMSKQAIDERASRIAGQILRETQGNPAAAITRLQQELAAMKADPDRYVSGVSPKTSQIVKSGELEGLESRVLAGTPEGELIRRQSQYGAQQVGSETANLKSQISGSVKPPDMAAAVGLSGNAPQLQASLNARSAIDALETAKDNIAKSAWNVPELKGVVVHKDNAAKHLIDWYSNLTAAKQTSIPKDITDLFAASMKGPDWRVSLNELQDLRSKILSYSREAYRKGDNFSGKINGDFAAEIASVINNPRNIVFTASGATPQASQSAWRNAVAATKDYYDTFRPEFMAKLIAESSPGSPKIAAGATFDTLFAGKNALRNLQDVRKSMGTSIDKDASDWLMGKLTSDGRNLNIKPQDVQKFLSTGQNTAIVNEIPGLRQRMMDLAQKAGESERAAMYRQAVDGLDRYLSNPERLAEYLKQNKNVLYQGMPSPASRQYLESLERSARILSAVRPDKPFSTKTLEKLERGRIDTILYGRATGLITNAISMELLIRAIGAKTGMAGLEGLGAAAGIAGKDKSIIDRVAGVANRTLFGSTEAEAMQKLRQALVDPELALKYMQKPTAENIVGATKLQIAGDVAKKTGLAAGRTLTGIAGTTPYQSNFRERELTIPVGRTQRASGGRINPSSKADGLVMAAEKAKKNINKTTEPLLNETDNNVAHALEIAGKHL